MSKKHEPSVAKAMEGQGTKNDNKNSGQEFVHLENQLKRALADYQNLEKRIAGEKSDWIRLANKDLLLKLLPGIDNLMLAEKHTQDEGIKISIKHFLDIFSEIGVKKIETVGNNFNPESMEAVGTVAGHGEGKVVEEVKSGYTLFDSILRPAQVIVGKENN